MAPPCRKIKYKERRSSKPVVRIKKRPPPVSVVPESLPSISEDSQQYFPAGEEEYEKLFEKPIQPTVDPIVCLRQWLRKQHFMPQDLSDDFLMFFLSASGYDLQLTADFLRKYFLSRQEPSPLFRDRDPLSPANVEIFKKLYVFPVPDTTETGKKIILTGLVEPTLHYNQIDHLKALAMVFDLLIWERDFGFGDYVIVFDGTGFQCPQLLENKVHNHRSIKRLLLDTIPGTLSSFFLLYPPPHVTNVANNRNGIWITLVKSKQDMIRYLPADVLPQEYGGSLGHLEDLLEQWDLHMLQSRKFFINFERKMTCDYNRRLRYEHDLATRGKNWVQNMKLEADEWEYKIQYYERLKAAVPIKHPAFGSSRRLMEMKSKSSVKAVNKCMKLAKEEEEAGKLFEPTSLYNGYAKEIRKAEVEAERENALQSCVPILELNIFYS